MEIGILLAVEQPQSFIFRHRSGVAELSIEFSLEHDITVSIKLKSIQQFERSIGVLTFYQNVKGKELSTQAGSLKSISKFRLEHTVEFYNDTTALYKEGRYRNAAIGL